MVKLSRKNSFDESDEEDPMAGVANLVDAMLVIAVGLLAIGFPCNQLEHASNRLQ